MESNAEGARPLRLAAYGFVKRDGGSVASANYLVLQRLIDLGHHVEFHAIGGFVVPDGLIGREGFSYVPTSIRPVQKGWRLIESLWPERRREGAVFGYSLVSNALHERAIGRELRRRHLQEPFDALLALGTLSPFRVPGLPCVAWPQGPPSAEWEALRSLRAQVVRHGGQTQLAMLDALYAHKRRVAHKQLSYHDMVIGCSEWSAAAWIRAGLPARKARAVPYAIDLDAFHPVERVTESPQVIRFLWLGRIVPRKRLDLLLSAYKRLRSERSDVELWVVGRFAYPKGLRGLLDEHGETPGLRHVEFIPRIALLDLFRRVDVVVQPSQNENLGSSVLEGLACGRPAVVGPSNGTKDYLGGASVIFDAYTIGSLHKALARAADLAKADPEGLALAARAAAERHCNVSIVTDQILSALREAIATAPR